MDFSQQIDWHIENVYQYYWVNWIEEWLAVLDSENRRSVRATGGTEIGLRHLETGKLDKILDATVFKTGLMKPTENFNRYLAVLTSRVEQQRLANTIRNTKLKDIYLEVPYLFMVI